MHTQETCRCGRKSKGDEKLVIDLEWPYIILDFSLNHLQILMNVHLVLTTAIQMLTVATLQAASPVPVALGSMEMEGLVQCSDKLHDMNLHV